METIVKRGRTTQTETTEKQAEPKKGTRPGWKPSSVLPQLKARSGFTARWIRNESGNIAKKLAEGWLLMKPSDNVGIAIRQTDLPDANPLAGEIRYRDSIAMMISDDDKAARQEYIRGENKSATSQIFRQTDEELKRAGVQMYAPKGQAGRIVIE
jgi:hypothetical protein